MLNLNKNILHKNNTGKSMKRLFLMMLVLFLIFEISQASARLLFRVVSLHASKLEMLERYNGTMLKALKNFTPEELIILRVIINSENGHDKLVQEIESFENDKFKPFFAFNIGRNAMVNDVIVSRLNNKRFAAISRASKKIQQCS